MSPQSFLERLRQRASAALDWYGPARALATAGSVVVVCIGAWWLLRAPSPPLEASLPFAGQAGSATTIQAEIAAVTLALPETSSNAVDMTVHVIGAVIAPGVYTIAASSRVVDAVTAAGGPTPQADLSSLNMALPLADADQVYVPPRSVAASRRQPPSTQPRKTNPTVVTVPQQIAAATSLPQPSAASPASSASGVVNINTADAPLLESLPGVGPSTAKAIIAHRQANGPFAKPEGLLEVKGIGDGKFAAMKQFVTVS
jgi:competence protein ComEA